MANVSERIKLSFVGKAENGRMKIGNPDSVSRFLKSLEGRDILLTVEAAKDTRTLAQNRYYWGVVVMTIAEETGAGDAAWAQQVHEFLAGKFLKTKISLKGTNGKKRQATSRKSTTALTTVEFNDYVGNCIAWAGELGISIPIPGEY